MWLRLLTPMRRELASLAPPATVAWFARTVRNTIICFRLCEREEKVFGREEGRFAVIGPEFRPGTAQSVSGSDLSVQVGSLQGMLRGGMLCLVRMTITFKNHRLDNRLETCAERR